MSTVNPYAPPQAEVRDIPTGVHEPASRGIRFVGVILDGLIAWAMTYLPVLVATLVIGVAPATSPQGIFSQPAFIVGASLGFLGFLAWCWITILFVSRYGQTIGKRLLGIKVIRSDGSRASLGRIFWLRNVVNILLSIIPLYGIVDALVIFGQRRQCLHDMIADTIVIRA